MIFKPLSLTGAWLIEPEPYRDDRGTFARTFCAEEFAANGLAITFPQHSLALTKARGTMRGMHFQRQPHAEIKLVRCVAGAVYDVIIDLRPKSATYGRWLGFELTQANGHQIYVPEGFAHGCQTLTDDASVQYLISKPYAPEAASGVRYNDPAFAITWPLPVTAISDRDAAWPLLKT
ncbi:MAG: dTDP-4-dehydrorhamnose 3,5-epimerase [Hyphomicrobiaceae bacterium]